MKSKSGHANLEPIRSKAEARARGKIGGIRSGEARREKKLLSQIYREQVALDFGLEASGLSFAGIIGAILARGDSASVAMLREIREATEGNKVKVEGGISVNITALDEAL